MCRARKQSSCELSDRRRSIFSVFGEGEALWLNFIVFLTKWGKKHPPSSTSLPSPGIWFTFNVQMPKRPNIQNYFLLTQFKIWRDCPWMYLNHQDKQVIHVLGWCSDVPLGEGVCLRQRTVRSGCLMFTACSGIRCLFPNPSQKAWESVKSLEDMKIKDKEVRFFGGSMAGGRKPVAGTWVWGHGADPQGSYPGLRHLPALWFHTDNLLVHL